MSCQWCKHWFYLVFLFFFSVALHFKPKLLCSCICAYLFCCFCLIHLCWLVCFIISQRDPGRDQTASCGARHHVSAQSGEGQRQPSSAGWAPSAQVSWGSSNIKLLKLLFSGSFTHQSVFFMHFFLSGRGAVIPGEHANIFLKIKLNRIILLIFFFLPCATV